MNFQVWGFRNLFQNPRDERRKAFRSLSHRCRRHVSSKSDMAFSPLFAPATAPKQNDLAQGSHQTRGNGPDNFTFYLDAIVSHYRVCFAHRPRLPRRRGPRGLCGRNGRELSLSAPQVLAELDLRTSSVVHTRCV